MSIQEDMARLTKKAEEMTDMAVIPYAYHESAMARNERREKRLIGLIIGLLLAVFITNGLWLWYESQFYVTETTVTYTTDSGDGGGNAIINESGEVGVYGNGD